jgi:hypothetical protein
MRRFCATFLVLTTAACGARTELSLGDADAECMQLDIGIFGNPGAYDSSTDFEQWLIRSGAGVQRIQTTPGEPVTAATLQPFDVAVLDWLTRDYTASEAATFAAWVAAGGGVMSMTGYNNTIGDWHANSLLAPLEIAYSGPLLSGPVTDFATHPITAGITSVVFEGGYAISDLGGHASARTPIAFLPAAGDDVNVGYEIRMGAGRAFVWGDEWIEFLSMGSTFPPQLWVQAFAWISPANKCVLTPPS